MTIKTCIIIGEEVVILVATDVSLEMNGINESIGKSDQKASGDSLITSLLVKRETSVFSNDFSFLKQIDLEI
jgi:hypothetical protein